MAHFAQLDDNNIVETIVVIDNNILEDDTENENEEQGIDYLKGIIELTTNEKDVVLDSFSGSGETGVACSELNRSFIGIELTDKYYDISKERLNNIQRELF